MGYKRGKLGAVERTPPSVGPNSPSFERPHPDRLPDCNFDKVGDNQIPSDASDIEKEDKAEDDNALDCRDQEYEDCLYQRIEQIQDNIDTHPTASFRNAAQGDLQEQLQQLKGRFPQLGFTFHAAEQNIVSVNREKLQFENAKVQTAASSKQLEEESSRGRSQVQNNQHMLKNVGYTIRNLFDRLEDSLILGRKHSRSEYEEEGGNTDLMFKTKEETLSRIYN